MTPDPESVRPQQDHQERSGPTPSGSSCIHQPMEPADKGVSLTDSVWFWLTVFSLMATVALAGIAGKYERRQGQIEGRFLGRQTLALERGRRAAGLDPSDLAENAADVELQARPQLIPLWPIAVTVTAIACGSGWMLVREIRTRAALRFLDRRPSPMMSSERGVPDESRQ